MAGLLIKTGNSTNIGVCEFVCDTEDEVSNLPTTTTEGTGVFDGCISVPIGSTCTVGNEGGDLLVYMLFSFGWKKL